MITFFTPVKMGRERSVKTRLLRTFCIIGIVLFDLSLLAQSPLQVAGTPTISATQNGNWTSASTWGGTLPTTDARIRIPNGITVTVDTQIPTEFKSLIIEGKLDFATNVNTELRCEYIVSTMTGELEIGTTTTPIDANVTAQIVFAERGGTDTIVDKERYAPGAVLMGPTRMHGTAKTGWLPLQVQPTAGSTQLTLQTAPSGWQVGDQLVVAGTDLTDYTSDEVVTVTAISGNTVTLSAPLIRDHVAPAQIQNLVQVHVGNLSRNIVISSENTSVAAIGGDEYHKPRGHLMFMHTLNVDLRYMSTNNIGRTDKIIEVDDWDATGLDPTPQPLPLIPGGYKNPRGRYSIHFHRGGTSPTLTAAHVEGCVVNGDPGWGFVNHSSRVNFVKNVAYDVVGSGFCTESGDETGSFVENFAVRIYNPDEPLNTGRPTDPFGDRTEALADARENLSDFAWQGDGFWFHSTGVTVTGNVVAGCTGHAYVYWSEGLVENNLGRATGTIDTHVPASEFPQLNAELQAWSQANPNWIFDVWYILCRPFQNNTAYNMARGVHGYYIMTTFHEQSQPDAPEFNLMPPVYRATNKFVIENTTLWGMRRAGMGFNHCTQIELKNNKVYGYGTSTGIAPWTSPPNQFTPYLEVEPAIIGMDLDFYHNDRNWRLENNIIKGFDGEAIALTLPGNADTTIVNGGTFDNAGTDIKIREVNWKKDWDHLVVFYDENSMDPLLLDVNTPWRRIDLQGNIQFDNPAKNIVLDPQFHLTNPAQDAFGILDGSIKMPGYFMLPDDIRLNFGPFNNTKIYFDHQHPDTIPATTATKYPLGLDPMNLFADQITPDQYLNKTNQQLNDQYGASFGGELLPATVVNHPMIINGKIIGGSVGLTEEVSQDKLMIYPNPTTGILKIQGVENGTVRIISMNGQVLHSANLSGTTTEMNISHFAPGLYFVSIENPIDGTILSQKLVKE